jgi:uncharacterized protein (TIGR02145 family)
MKKFTFIILICLAFINISYGQTTISLTFSAELNSLPASLDSIKIENLTQGGDTTLYSPDTVLILDYVTGISPNYSYDNSSFIVQCHPNPFSEKTNISLYLPSNESVNIEVYDLLGIEVATYQNTLPAGNHGFSFYPGNEKFYFLVVETNYKRKILKMVHLGTTKSASSKIIYEASHEINFQFKSGKSFFAWTPGDELKFTGYITSGLNNVLSNTLIDIPAQNAQYIFSLTLLTAPTISTLPITFITTTGATCGGNITNDGGSAVTARGVCWSTTSAPTTANSITTDGTGTGVFPSSIIGLSTGITYYVRAYATNSIGTAYGNELSFIAQQVTIPQVTTINVTSITSTDAICNGDVTDDGGSTVTARGVCWSTSATPTIADSITINGTGTGAFNGNITGLMANTTYYVRTYATNSEGTAYGNELSFTTLPAVLPTVVTTSVTNITDTTALGGGDVTNNGGANVILRGVCWSINPTPTTANSNTSNGTGTGSFTSNITNLLPATTYYVRAYATNNAGTSYGNEINFTTLAQLPTITTTAISAITSNTAAGGGNITNDGGSAVTARGICWSTSTAPTTANNITSNGTGIGSFTSNLTGLLPGTTYYVRAYATNSVGTVYGNEISFTTLIQLASVNTSLVNSITSISAVCGGYVTSDGGSIVTARGVCWGINPNPTTSDFLTTNGSGIGSFTSSIGGLTLGNTYYVRAYATNNAGTSYGNEINFTTTTNNTSPCGGITTVTDVSGNSYNVVAIGIQCWMKENLKTTKYNNNTSISNITNYNTWATTTTGAYAWYNNDINNKTNYGALYNGFAVDTATNGNKNICPLGWHVPTASDWALLREYLGDDSLVGCKLKETGFTYWNSPNTCANNSSGFSARGSGWRESYLGTFDMGMGQFGTWWCDKEFSVNMDGTKVGQYRLLAYDSTKLKDRFTDKNMGASVRCVRKFIPDADFSTSPSLIFVGDTVWFTDLTSYNPTNWYWDFGDGNNSNLNNPIHVYSSPGNYTVSLTVSNNFGADSKSQSINVYGVAVPCPGIPSFVDQRDNTHYNTVQIGNQCWMKENLKYLPSVSGNIYSNTIPYYYVYDYNGTNVTIAKGKINYNIYGVLYNWTAAMNGFNDNPSGVTGICPQGWHLPSDNEWKQLEMFLGMSQADADTISWRGTVEGGLLKTTDTIYWGSPNTGATNSTGFSALPGGMQNSAGINYWGSFWSSSENGQYAYHRSVFHAFSSILRDDKEKKYGHSVRCIKGDLAPCSYFNAIPTNITVFGDTVWFSDQSINSPSTWNWDFGDGNTSTLQNPWHVYSDTGSYTISLTTGNYIGSHTETKTNYITVNHFPITNFEANLISVNKYDTVSFNDLTLNFPTSWFWNFGDGNTSTLKNPWHVYLNSGFYTVTLTATNLYGSQTETKINYIKVSNQPCPGMPSFTDSRDGKQYNTVKIGNQCWMKENLNYVTSSGSICQQCSLYGMLYTWATAMDGWSSSNNNPSGVQGICPTGWHLPSDNEWKEMEMSLGMTQLQVDSMDNRGTIEGGLLKTSNLWISPNTGANNLSNFSALPAGYYGGANQGSLGYFWTSTENGTQAWMRSLSSFNSKVFRYYFNKNYGYSIRCVRDTSNIPEDAYFNAAPTHISIGDTVWFNDLSNNNPNGWYWQFGDGNTSTLQNPWHIYSNAGIFSVSLTSSNINGSHTLIKSNIINVYGPCPSIPTVIDADSNIYNTTYLNNQCWLKENLKTTKYSDGTTIPLETNNTSWSVLTTPAFCWYNNDSASCVEYGALYNWYTLDTVTNGGKYLCPTGWHVASLSEWNHLFDYLGDSVAGGKLKEAGTSHWVSPNSGATNETYFTALPGGNRISDGSFVSKGNNGFWWAFDEYNASNGWRTMISNSNIGISTNYTNKYFGVSVRCIKSNSPILTSLSIISNYSNMSNFSANVTDDGGSAVNSRGICWSTSPNPTISNNITNDGAGLGNFTSVLSGLTPNTTYYVRAYAINNIDVAYSNQITFTVPQLSLPLVTTTAVSSITSYTAVSGGNVTNEGGTPVTAYGICWKITTGATIADNKTIDGAGLSNFSSNITSLLPGTTYYVRAYATNNQGTAYGNELSFTTPTVLATLNTTVISGILATSAVGGGNVLNDGGAPVTVRGICWNTNPSPTTANSKTTNGSGNGSFTSNMYSLSPNTTYYVRAYATNTVGTVYGNEVSFTTAMFPACLGVTDTRDGRFYQAVQIGNQCWMTENLKYLPAVFPDDSSSTTLPRYYVYNYQGTSVNDAIATTNYATYGVLYNWAAVMAGTSSSITNPSNVQGVCPAGWHVPSDAEWTQLTNFLGDVDEAGGKLKEIGFTHWNSPNKGATNETGFTALPGGIYNGSSLNFNSLATYGYWWTSTQYPYSSSSSWRRYMSSGASNVNVNNNYKHWGFSVRCLIDF